ncbi:hypothetical protein [Helicobacter canis]|uniref:Glycosyltransferase n=1 Tax=Helicobacter canis TaxID=29419 RepID=A0A377J2L5_9HELI|nr:hypothetical protein [Helicobacter canis]STO96589.1 glycosyltransferase [Helicobacter canis]
MRILDCIKTGGGGTKDSASGNHSSDFVDFRATADHKSSSTLKSTKSTTSNTANPRIFEEENGVECEKSRREQLFLESTFSKSPDSSSAILESKSGTETQITKNAQPLESTFSQSHDSKSNAHFLSLRALHRKAWQSIQKTAQLLESTFENAAADTQKVDSSVDCRAAATAPARNDTKNATSKKVDSRNTFLSSLQALLHQRSTSTKNINKDSSTTQNVATPQAATRRYSPISTLWRAATSRTKLLLQTIRNATLSALDKCTHSLRRPFIADKDGYCKHCGYRLYKPQWLQELESKHSTKTQANPAAKPKQKDKNEKSNNPKPRSRSREV